MDYKLINEYRQQGKTYREIMDLMGIPCEDHKAYDNFRKKLKYYNRKTFKEGTSITADPEYKPTWATVHYDNEGKIIQEWQRGDTKKDWHEDILKAISEAKPFEKTLKDFEIRTTKTMLEIPLFDMHLGISDYEYYHYVQYQIAEEIRKGHSKVLFAIGSDLFHNNDHRGRTAKGTPVDHVDMCKAFDDALSFFVPLLRLADEYADEVEVIYVKGNHDETPSWYFVKHLSALFPELKYNHDFEEKKVTVWEEIFIGFTHGDKGQKAIPEVFIEEWAIQWAHAKVREIHTGHLHVLKERDSYSTQIRTLPTGGKTDQWSKDGSFQGAIKKFKIFVYGPDRILDEIPIYQR